MVALLVRLIEMPSAVGVERVRSFADRLAAGLVPPGVVREWTLAPILVRPDRSRPVERVRMSLLRRRT
jgi:hypothetical protein